MRESDLLSHIYSAAAHTAPRFKDMIQVGPGDDMGVIQVGTEQLLAAVDQIIDGVHFNLGATSLGRIGRKAVTRNLSDIAAMAALPVAALAAVCLPRDFTDDRARELFDAVRTTGETFGCPVFGGDISICDGKLVCCVTVLAQPAGIQPVLRRGAKLGDAIYVTGHLGGSMENVAGTLHHLDFQPRIELARTLTSNKTTRPHCMIDISDGLARDLAHLCRAAEDPDLAAIIHIDQLPISPAAKQAAKRTGQPSWKHAAGDGEDYELLFTAPPHIMPPQIGGIPITQIGHIIRATESSASPVRFISSDGEEQPASDLGWEHHT